MKNFLSDGQDSRTLLTEQLATATGLELRSLRLLTLMMQSDELMILKLSA